MIFYIPWMDKLVITLSATNKTVFICDEYFEVGLLRDKRNATKFGWVYIGEI